MAAQADIHDDDDLPAIYADRLPRPVATVPFSEAMQRMDWRQGEHVTLIGPTGLGKTELTVSMLDAYKNEAAGKYIVFLGTKRKDSTQDELKSKGYNIIKDARALEPQVATKYIVKPDWPSKVDDAEDIKRYHRDVFRSTIIRCIRQGGWTIVCDELRYLAGFLGLSDELLVAWLQGRSEHVSVVSSTQRPRYVPLEAYDQPTHLFFFRDSDHGNVRRVAELVSVHRGTVEVTVPNLPEHDVLYTNTRTGDIFITNTRS